MTASNRRIFLDSRRQPLLPLRDREERLRDYLEIHRTVNREIAGIAVEEAGTCLNCGEDDCGRRDRRVPSVGLIGGCPLGNQIREWHRVLKGVDKATLESLVEQLLGGTEPRRLSESKDSKVREALRLLKRSWNILSVTNPFPEFFVACPAFCQHGCIARISANESGTHTPIGIQLTEHFIAWFAWQMGWVQLNPRTATGKNIAVIGTGPAGLAVIQRLREAGHEVHGFEKASEPGGLLLIGIPEFHLDKEIVRRRVRLIQEAGAHFHCNTEFPRDKDIDALRAEFDWVIIATGASRPRTHPKLAGLDVENAVQAMDYLTNPSRYPIVDQNLLGVGGGFTMLDLLGTWAREITRGGHSSPELATTLVRKDSPEVRYQAGWEVWDARLGLLEYDEALQDPLWEHEVEEFVVEGRRIVAAMVRDDQQTVKRMPLAWFFQAMGFLGPELPVLDGLKAGQRGGIKLHEQGELQLIRPADVFNSTTMDKVSVAGDASLGASTIVEATAEGMRTAWAVHKRLGGADFRLLPKPAGIPSLVQVGLLS